MTELDTATIDDCIDHEPADADADTATETETETETETDAAPSFVDDGYFSTGQFGEYYNVHAQFLPFENRIHIPLDVLTAVKTTINIAPATSQYIRRSDVDKRYDGPRSATGNAWAPTDVFLVHGAYPLEWDEFTGVVKRFANPRYIHHHELPSATETDDRLKWLDRYTALGTVGQTDILDHLGYRTRSGLADFLRTHEYDWRANRQAGLQRRARTWKTLAAWGAHYRDIAAAFDTTTAAVEKTINRRAGDFEPPADPTADGETA